MSMDLVMVLAQDSGGSSSGGGGAGAVVGKALVLVSYWKPIIFLIPMVLWAAIISKIYDKHAARFFLPRKTWNIAHLCVGLAAFAAAMLMPVPGIGGFFAGLGVMLLILAGDIVAYAMVANKDERVPEEYRIKVDIVSKMRDKKEAKAKAKLQSAVSLVVRKADAKGKFAEVVSAPQPETPEYEARVAAEDVIKKAIAARAAQVDFAPTGKDNQYATSYLVDGVRTAGETLAGPVAVKVMDFWRAAAGLDVQDRRRKLQGMVQTENNEGGKTVVRVTSMGGQGGMRVTLLFNPEQAVTRKLADLGLLEPQLAALKKIVEEEKGVVLVASPPDGGRTTTLYAMTRMHDAYMKNVQLVETDPQAALEGVRSNKFEADKEGAEFSTLVRSVIRRDPQIVSVAELPDANTAKEIAKADVERIRVYVGVRAENALQAIEAWVKAVGDPAQAGKVLHGVVAQKMLRKLCTNCRMSYPAAPDMLKKLGVPEGKVSTLYKKGGQVLIKNKPEVCPVCNGVGYYGQDAAFEIYEFTPEDRELLSAGNLEGVRSALRKKQQPTIQQAAIRKAIDGATSVEEITRITTPGGGAAPGAAPAGGAAAPGAPKPAQPAAPRA
jgi:type II secretory ATPase GspE/PulE/Tfp pilus assembly ATPase PilB-like protein